jgi:hypothetical protein
MSLYCSPCKEDVFVKKVTPTPPLQGFQSNNPWTLIGRNLNLVIKNCGISIIVFLVLEIHLISHFLAPPPLLIVPTHGRSFSFVEI